jgi:hypothetical protein
VHNAIQLLCHGPSVTNNGRHGVVVTRVSPCMHGACTCPANIPSQPTINLLLLAQQGIDIALGHAHSGSGALISKLARLMGVPFRAERLASLREWGGGRRGLCYLRAVKRGHGAAWCSEMEMRSGVRVGDAFGVDWRFSLAP